MTLNRPRDRSFVIFFFCLLAVVLLLFHQSLLPGKVLFSNDGPLGAMNQAGVQLPSAFTGVWYDLNVIGLSGGISNPDLSEAFLWLTGPVGYAKFVAAFSVFFLGICAWLFFRQTRLVSLACALGGLSAALNSDFFSVACWGVIQQTLCFGFNFLALAALSSKPKVAPWLRFVLAGFAIGMGVNEGVDIGIIFSLYLGAYVIYSSLTEEGPAAKRLALGIGRVAVVGGFAIFMAATTIVVQLATAVSGVAGAKQDTQTREQRWDFCTQWSLPKKETLSLVVPGLFGYRMTSSSEGLTGGDYWGSIGMDAAWQRYFEHDKEATSSPGGGFLRQTGGGVYAGVLVVLVALWAASQALRKTDSVFTLAERKQLWFWTGAAVISLLLAYGRYAPFYRLLYAVPYVSTIRSPAKHLHLTSFSLIILFAFGIHGIWRKYLSTASVGASGLGDLFKAWWKRASAFEKKWVKGLIVVLVGSVLLWILYAGASRSLEQHLIRVKFDEQMAKAIAGFSVRQVGWYILFLALSVGLLLSIWSGAFAGTASRLGGVLLGAILLLDQGIADLPWILHWDYEEKYSSDPIIELLRKEPYEHRVAFLPLPPPAQFREQFELLSGFYKIQWAQHQFQYYNIQSLDVVQMPRPPEDLVAFESALLYDGTTNTMYRVVRRWQLTNTRLFLGFRGLADSLNAQLDPAQRRFHAITNFDIALKPNLLNYTKTEDLAAVPKPESGYFSIYEFAGALPRAKLYSNWQVITNGEAALHELGAREFDPEKTVIVSSPLPGSPAATNEGAGDVRITNYKPNHITLKADARANCVLLLNDRNDPDWHVYVDGKAEQILHCNYVMRGVYLTPGSHVVEFRFQPSMKYFYVTLAAIGLAFVLTGFVVFVRPRNGYASPSSEVVRPTDSPAPGGAKGAKKAQLATK